MPARKWQPLITHTEETARYRYEYGYYLHPEYNLCFRIVKYQRLSGTYVGHFVLVEDDMDLLRMFLHWLEGYQQEAREMARERKGGEDARP